MVLLVSSLGPSALKIIEATASVKRKEPSHSSAQPKEKKKKKSALDEIMEVQLPIHSLALEELCRLNQGNLNSFTIVRLL